MVARWSRALRNPGSCKCIPCLANPPVGFRCAGALGLRGFQTSAFTYTAAFPTGFAVDTPAKKRNKQWDTPFDPFCETARALEKLSNPQPPAEEHGINKRVAASQPLQEADWDAVSRVIAMELDDDPVLEQRQTESDKLAIPEVLWDLLSIDARGPSLLDWPSSTGLDPGKRRNLPPQSLWALETARLKAKRNRQTPKKLAIQELSVCLMVHRLLAESKAHMASDDTFVSLSPHICSVALFTPEEVGTSIRRIRANITALETTPHEDWPEDPMTLRIGTKFDAEPDYVQDEDGDFHHIASQLNVAIKALFTEYHFKRESPEGMAVATAKLCHNLLVSSAAPNLETFNILLTGFQKWECPSLTDIVIEALDNCKVRPNEITCAAILEHYTDTQRPDDFSHFVAKMRGAGSALMLARPTVNVNAASQGRLVRTSEKKVLQKVYPTPLVFDALMRGVFAFAGFDRAMDIYYEMKADGWGLDARALSRLLDDCMHRGDWAGGLAVWEEIASIQGHIRQGMLTKVYGQFLALCSIAQKPVAFNTVLADVSKRKYNRKGVLNEWRANLSAVKRGRGHPAPAWTADNLLIAVSDYMKDDGGDADAKTAEFFKELYIEEEQKAKAEAEAESKDSVGASSDAWDAWLEHELGDTKAVKPPDR